MVSPRNILILLAYIIEPCAWLYSMKLKFNRKYKNIALYLGYVLFDITVSLVKEFSTIGDKTGDIFFTVLIFTYVTIFINIAFLGDGKKKIIHIGELFFFSFICDFVVLLCFMMIGVNAAVLSEQGVMNSIATLFSKILIFVIVRVTFKKPKKPIDKELAPTIFLVLVLELPTMVFFQMGNGTFFTIYGITQIIAAAIIMYIKHTNENRNEAIRQIKKRAEQLENEKIRAEARARKIENEANTRKPSADGPKMLEFFENRKKIYINSDSIVFAERTDRKISIYTDSERHEVNTTITKLEDILGKEFVKINQGTIANINQIKIADGETILLISGKTLHASRKRVKEIQEILGD